MKKTSMVTSMVMAMGITLGSAMTLTPNVSAQAAEPISWITSSEDSFLYYDLNQDGLVNTADMVLLMMGYVYDDTFGITDIENMKNYIVNGKLASFDFQEIDIDGLSVNEENDNWLQNITSGYLVERGYTDGAIRLRYLKDGMVTELRCSTFAKSDNLICVDESTKIDNCGYTYTLDPQVLFDNSTVKWNYNLLNPEEIDLDELDRAIYVKDYGDIPKIYVDCNDCIKEITIQGTENITKVMKTFNVGTRMCIVGLDENNQLALYQGSYSYWDLDDMVANVIDDRFLKNISGKVFQIDQENGNVFLHQDDGTLKQLHLTRYADTEEVLCVAHLGEVRLWLGVTSDKNFAWDMYLQ